MLQRKLGLHLDQHQETRLLATLRTLALMPDHAQEVFFPQRRAICNGRGSVAYCLQLVGGATRVHDSLRPPRYGSGVRVNSQVEELSCGGYAEPDVGDV